MTDKGRMTPGPWHVGLHSGLSVFADEQEIVIPADGLDLAEARANARAIACLPELVEAARESLAIFESPEDGWDDEGNPTAQANQATHVLRRILARIDGEDA